ncbi:MAG: hypothetical protein AAB857_01920 [Patescibacteria group bacterium]
MAWAQDMKNLASNIKTSTGDRLQFVKDNQKDMHNLLSRFDQELKNMAQDLKIFLDKSKKDRIASEKDRMADFSKMMKDVQSRVEDIQKHVAGLLGDYAEERKEAHVNWGMLRKRERAIAEEKAEEVEKEAKKAKKHKAE